MGDKLELTISQLQQELLSARQNEERYRKLAEQSHELSQLVGQMTRALGLLSRSKTLKQSGLSAALLEILEQSSTCLRVERAGVWLFEADKLKCLAQRANAPLPAPFAEDQIPVYFASIQEATVLAAHDIFQDPRTIELHEYAAQSQVGALLDAPIRVFGELVGVVCHEHKEAREWLDEECGFAAAVGDIIALALMTQKEYSASLSASASEAKHRALVEALPVAIYSFQPYAEPLNYISPQIRDISGVSAEEWHAQGGLRAWLARVHPNDKYRLEARLKKGLLTGAEPDTEYRIQHADGTWRWVRDSYRVVRNADGAPVALQGVIQDITAQVRALDEKREAERRFYELLAQGQLLAFTLDESGKITFLNDALKALLERPDERLIGQDWFEITLPEASRPHARELLLSPSRRQEEAAIELPLLLPDGHILVRWAVTQLTKSSGQPSGVACIGMSQAEGQEEAALTRLTASAASELESLSAEAPGADERQRLSELARGLRLTASKARELTEINIEHFISENEGLLRAWLGKRLTLSLSLRAPGTEARLETLGLLRLLLCIASDLRAAMPTGGKVTLSTEEVFLDPKMARQRARAVGSYVSLQLRGEPTEPISPNGWKLLDGLDTKKFFGGVEVRGLSAMFFLQRRAKV